MNTLEFLDNCNFSYFRSFRARFYTDDVKSEWLINFPDRLIKNNSELNDINICAWNLCGYTNEKLAYIKFIINKYELDIIWLMECKKRIGTIKGYHAIYSTDPNINVLLIRNSLYGNGTIKYIEFGIKFENISFRYIKPSTNSTYIEWNEYEIGDYNWLSHKWLRKDLILEERNGKPGGMGTNIPNSKFINSYKSDHDIIIANIKYKWTPKINTNYYQLEHSINYAAETGIWKPIFGRENLNYIEEDERFKNNKRDSKIINLKEYNLSLQPWYNIYNHDINKHYFWKESIETINKIENINSKAIDINGISAKMAIKIFNKLNTKQKENLLIAWKVLKNETRAIALRKKDKEIKTVTDTRLIQIYPVHLKIQEKSRLQLKRWLEKQNTPIQYGFIKGRNTANLINDWIKQIKLNNVIS